MNAEATVLDEPRTEMTTQEGYAQRWGVSGKTVALWLKSGLPHVRTSKRMIRIDAAAADSWMNQRFGRGA
jgi:hypothetical protein